MGRVYEELLERAMEEDERLLDQLRDPCAETTESGGTEKDDTSARTGEE